MPQVITFGSWLQQRRKALGFTQAGLAEQIGCSPQTIYKIEAGQRRPSEQIAMLLARQFQVAVHEVDAFVQFARAETDSTAEHDRLLHAPWRTRFLPPHNLPTQLTTVVGRAHDIGRAVQILRTDTTRLLTFVGPPGVGKTRLSIEVGHEVLVRFRDGTFFVQLAAITDPELLAPAIARALDIYESAERIPFEGLKRYLYDRETLLILDNFEQLLDAAPRVTNLLAACPLLKVIVTSREPLRVRGERRFPVPALSLPDRDMVNERSTGAYAESAAIELFVQRAQAVQPDFKLTKQNGAPLATLCTELDGLPLAIEIVSARVDRLSPDELLHAMLGSRLLQADGWRDAGPRHQTLNTAIGWSYELLDAQEQQLFRQLGIFAGGLTPAAVERIADLNRDVLPFLKSLVEKNLLVRDVPDDAGNRYRMLQTIREYALWQLAATGELGDVQHRFAHFFLDWAGKAEQAMRGHQQVAWIERVDREHDNLRAVLDFHVERRDWTCALRLAGSLYEFWVYRGYISEGARRLRHLLDASASSPVDPSLRAKALNGAAMLSYFAGDYGAIVPYTEEALQISLRLNDDWNVALASMSLGMALAGQRFFEKAAGVFDQGLAAARRTGEDWLVATLLNGLGEVARSQGDIAQATALLTSSLSLGETSGHRWMVTHVLDNLGHVAYAARDYDRAMAYYRRSLDASLALNDQRGVAMCLEKLGGVAVAQGHAERAARLLGGAEALRELKNAPVEGMDRQDYESFVAATRNALSEERLRAAWSEGRRMSVAEAITFALG